MPCVSRASVRRQSPPLSVIEALDVRERHGYTRTLAKLSPLKRDVDNAEAVDPGLGTAVVYFAHEPENSAAYTGPELIETLTLTRLRCA